MTNFEYIVNNNTEARELILDTFCKAFNDCLGCPCYDNKGNCNMDKETVINWFLGEYDPFGYILNKLKKGYPQVERKIQEFKKAFIDCSYFTHNTEPIYDRDDEVIMASIDSYLMALENSEIITAEESWDLKKYITGKGK
jgi:hypothetical protein